MGLHVEFGLLEHVAQQHAFQHLLPAAAQRNRNFPLRQLAQRIYVEVERLLHGAGDDDAPKGKAKAKPKKAAQSPLGAPDEPKPMSGRTLAMLVVLALSKELADILAGRPTSSMGTFLASRLDLTGLRRLDRLLETVQEALVGQVNPALTLDWMATRVALWVR